MRIYNSLFSRDKSFVKRIRSLIGFTPANLGIFKLAFYHKSTTSDKLYAVQSNERLEYLGDAVLATIVAEYLFKKYPNSNEGFLTKMRSKIVKRQSLNIIADKMGLDVFLNQYNNTRLSRSMLGNALEALVGAIYLEKGYNGTKRFVINKILLGYLDIHELESFDDNYKSQLLEWCQKNGKTVSYKMVSKYKFEKRDRFKVAVLIDGEKVAIADDFNKKSAEQTASEKAMKILGILMVPEDIEKKSNKNKKGYRKPRADRPSKGKDNRSQDRPSNKKNNQNRQDRKPKDRKEKKTSDWDDLNIEKETGIKSSGHPKAKNNKPRNKSNDRNRQPKKEEGANNQNKKAQESSAKSSEASQKNSNPRHKRSPRNEDAPKRENKRNETRPDTPEKPKSAEPTQKANAPREKSNSLMYRNFQA